MEYSTLCLRLYGFIGDRPLIKYRVYNVNPRLLKEVEAAKWRSGPCFDYPRAASRDQDKK